jgi:hypothetical protein
MRGILRPILMPMLRRAPDEVDRAARHFSVGGVEARELVAGVGRAFLGGYHAMLEARTLDAVAAAGTSVEPHFRPFFFEGAAMGYLPRAYFTQGTGPNRVEADLLAMDVRFLYLYYVGLGFWYGFRHPRRPGAIEALAPHVDPFYLPLCYDGFGFKLGFFDFSKRPDARAILDRAPESRRAEIYQGFGRALFFVCRDDEERFAREKSALPAERRNDVESGRSLALAFTGLRRPERILLHLSSAKDDGERALRLLGVTWALTARAMNDPAYFEQCLGSLPPPHRALLRLLPQRCLEAREAAAGYAEWRAMTKGRAASAYADSFGVGRR